MQQKITTFLWFDNNVEEAIQLYISIFKDSKILSTMRNSDGSVLGYTFQLEGQKFMAINGGPVYKLTEAISLFVDCETQEEVDSLWAKLTEGGKESRCGWLKDKFGLSWQIIPRALMQMLQDPDPEKAKRARDAMLQMGKIDVQGLRRAYDGR